MLFLGGVVLLKLVLGFYESAFEVLMLDINRFTSAIHTLAKPHSPAWLEGVLVLGRSSSTTAVAKEVIMHKAGGSPASRDEIKAQVCRRL